MELKFILDLAGLFVVGFLQRRFVYLLVFLQSSESRVLDLPRTFSSFGNELIMMSPENVYGHNVKKWTKQNILYFCFVKCIAFLPGEAWHDYDFIIVNIFIIIVKYLPLQKISMNCGSLSSESLTSS